MKMDMESPPLSPVFSSLHTAHYKRKRELSTQTSVKEEQDEPVACSDCGSEDDFDTDSADSDGGGYNENDEAFPAVPIYNLSVPKLKARLDDVIRGAQDIFAKHSSGNEVVHMLRESLEAALYVSWPPLLNIALVGDAGVGTLKSDC